MNYEHVNNLYESLCDKYVQIKESVTDSKKIDKLTDVSERLMLVERYLSTSARVAFNALKKIEKDLNNL